MAIESTSGRRSSWVYADVWNVSGGSKYIPNRRKRGAVLGVVWLLFDAL